jgi:transcriptional regulator with XRE-family HTH domain
MDGRIGRQIAEAPAVAEDDPDVAIVAALGERVKRLRRDGALTLDALALRSGVSRAMLSKVERGEKSPTLAIIARIARGLEVTLSGLLGAEPNAADVTIIRADERLSFTEPESGFRRALLSPAHLDNGVELIQHDLPAGSSTGLISSYTYEAPTEKYLVVHQGTLTIEIGETRHVLGTGDSIYFEIKESYSFVNDGLVPCSYYLVKVRKR